MARGGVDQAFDDVDRLGETGPARHTDRRRVGQNGADAQSDVGNIVDAALQMRILKDLQAAGAAAHVSADIRDTVGTQPEKLSVRIERQRRLGQMIACLVIAEENFASAGDPFHRPAASFRCPWDQRLLGIREVFGAEPTADIRRDEAQSIGWHVQNASDRVAIAVQALAGDVSDELFRCGIVDADDAARFHRIGNDTMVMQAQRNDVRAHRRTPRPRRPVASPCTAGPASPRLLSGDVTAGRAS